MGNPNANDVGGGADEGATDMSERFDEEWFWVFGSGIAAVVVVAANLLLLVSICRNRFLVGANTHRAFALIAIRNLVRACFALAVLYSTRWHYATRMFKKSGDHFVESLLCDILCSLDTFLLALPMYLLVGLAVHMFTRFPSPQIGRPYNSYTISAYESTSSSAMASEELFLAKALLPKEPCWVTVFLPVLPIIMAGLVITPVPLLHLTHSLHPVPNKSICSSDYLVGVTPSSRPPHLTYDVSVFILAYCLPTLLVIFLAAGLTVRRCVQCSFRHCLNSWCKEESVLVQLSIITVVSQSLVYLPVLEALADKLNLEVARTYINLLEDIYFLGRPEVARAIEVVAGGLALPLLCYAWMPAYRAFGACPDQRDLRLVLKAEGRQLRIGHESSLSLCSTQRPVQLLSKPYQTPSSPSPSATVATSTIRMGSANSKSTDDVRNRQLQHQ